MDKCKFINGKLRLCNDLHWVAGRPIANLFDAPNCEVARHLVKPPSMFGGKPLIYCPFCGEKIALMNNNPSGFKEPVNETEEF